MVENDVSLVGMTPVASPLERLANLHPPILRFDETLLSVCEVGTLDAVARPHSAGPMGRLGRLFRARPCGSRHEMLRSSIDAAFGPFTELPEAQGQGCLIGVTNLRVLILDLAAQQLLAECPVDGVELARFDHGAEVVTLLFDNGTELISVTVAEAGEMVDHFVAAYPNRGVTKSAPAAPWRKAAHEARRRQATAEPELGEPALGKSALGESALGESALGESALGEPVLGEPALGESALGNSALGAAVA